MIAECYKGLTVSWAHARPAERLPGTYAHFLLNLSDFVFESLSADEDLCHHEPVTRHVLLTCHEQAAGDDDGVYDDLHPEESEENLQLDADDDDMEENGPLDNEMHDNVENGADQQQNGPTLDGDHLEEEDLGQDGDTGNRDTNADHNIQADSGRQAVNEDHVPRDSTHDHAGYGLHRHGISIGQGDRSHQDTSNHKHQGRHERIQRGSGDRGRLGTSDGAGTVGRESELLWKRRSQAVKLYSGVVELALQPRREDIAASCAVSGVDEVASSRDVCSHDTSEDTETTPCVAV